MKVVLASTSELKEQACRAVFAKVSGFELQTVKVPSGVSEQPFNEETRQGAFNRMAAACVAVPGADLYIGIENGIFEEKGRYIDRAVVVLTDMKGKDVFALSAGVEFPADCVEEAQRRGFDKVTVGQVMAEKGIVRHHDDPHADLSSHNRAYYLRQGLRRALKTLANRRTSH